MDVSRIWKMVTGCLVVVSVFILMGPPAVYADTPAKKKGAAQTKGPPPAPVRVAPVVEQTVSRQLSLIGTTEAFATSTVAAEVSGVVERFPVKAGDFVSSGQLLVQLRDRIMRLRLKSYVAEQERVRANLENAEKELNRLQKLRATNSIAETKYDTALYAHRALTKVYLKTQAEIDLLEYQIGQTKVFAPFDGFIAEEHTQVGEWINPGGPVVTLLDMTRVLVTVDVPERYALKIVSDQPVGVRIGSVSDRTVSGDIHAILHQGNASARTLPVWVRVENPGYKIRAGMEARVTFDLSDTRQALLVPKDAVVTAGSNRMVYAVAEGIARPVGVTILGYYDGSVAVAGDLKPGMTVVVRGNERLRPGQPVTVAEP